MNKIKNFTKRFGVSVVSLVVPLLASASPAQPNPAGTGSNGASGVPTVDIAKVQDVLDSVCTIFGWMFYFLIALAVVFVVIAAFKYLTSSGDSEKVKSAGNTLLYAAIAIGVGLLAKAIPLIVGISLALTRWGLQLASLIDCGLKNARLNKYFRKVEYPIFHMKKVKGFAKEIGVSVLSLVLPVMASAQNLPVPTPPQNPGNVPQGNISSIQGVLNTVCIVFDWMFYFLVALAVIFIIVAAFKYLTAAGDPEKVKGAGSTLLYAAIAVGVALLARAVPLIVASFLGANGLTTC